MPASRATATERHEPADRTSGRGKPGALPRAGRAGRPFRAGGETRSCAPCQRSLGGDARAGRALDLHVLRPFHRCRLVLAMAPRARDSRRSVFLRGGGPRKARGRYRHTDGNPPRYARDRGRPHRLFARTAAHAARDRSAVSPRTPCVRGAGLPAIRMEVQRTQRAVAAGGIASWLHLRRYFLPAHDRQGTQPGYRLVRDARSGMAGAEAGV